MTTYRIRHDQTQGLLMRALGAVSRRGLPFISVQDQDDTLTLEVEVNPKTHGQLLREWNSIIGVKGVQTWKTYRWE